MTRMDIEQALLSTINIAVIASVILFVGFESVRGFVFRKASAFARIVYLLLALSNVVYGAERGKPFVPPPSLIAEPEPTIRIVVDQVPVSKSAARPIDASVLIDVIDGPSHFTGSGTCISSENGESVILTCWHTWRGVNNPQPRVTHQKKDYVATILKEDRYLDLALLSIKAELPFVEIALSQPPVGSTIISIGASVNGQNLVERSHEISLIGDGPGFVPPVFETEGNIQAFGRSGGGAFFRDELCGVIVGFNPKTATRSQYAPYSAIRSFLAKSSSGAGGKLKAIAYTGEDEYGKGWCVNCGPAHERFGNGNADLELEWSTAVAKGPQVYPAYRFIGPDGGERFPANKRNQYRQIDSLEDLIDVMRRAGCEPESTAVASGPVGATIQGRAFLEKAFGYLQDGAEYRLKWIRRGGKEALLMGKIPTREELIGTDGRFELSTTASGLPVHTVAFEYRFANDKVYLKFDEIECDLPEQNTVGSSQPVGSVILTVWTVFSVIQTIHAILTPTIDIWLGEEINATAKFEGGKLSVDCVPNPPSIRAHWSFWFGFLKFDYQRPLTGVVLGLEEVVAQFHQSRRLRDWAIPVE